ncbi:ornithine carbamoyltransferase [Candidatus Saccharibacteria bacterium]|nr:ornithine carbamoyltransferase [Candidatus Saccharibacteria bacterium]
MNFYGRDFLRILDFSEEELKYMLAMARKFKEMKKAKQNHKYFPEKNIAILFEKTSTRTRCSFEVAGYDLGMGVTYLDPTGSQMGHKESIADTARVLARLYDGIEYRGFDQKIVDELAEYADVPVWNGLTDECHPTQALGDFMTIEEHFGHLKGLTLAFVGDTRNNVANSLMAMSAKMGVNFIACGPVGLRPSDEIIAKCQPIAEKNDCTITVTDDISILDGRADAIYTDVWLSLGEDSEKWGERIELLKPYQVNMDLMQRAKDTAVFLHCLPSFHDLNTSIARDVKEKYGLDEMEVTNEVFESDKSIVFEQAENRMHTIKSVMFLTLWDPSLGKKSLSEKKPG